MAMLHQTSWLLHWCLVFSFASEKSNGLFAALLADKANFGDAYLNVIQLRSPNLMRHMIASFILGRSQTYYQQPSANIRIPFSPLSKDSLHSIALPIILAEKDVYSDSFTKFTIALLDDYDFDNALIFAKEMFKEAEQDILLRPHAAEIYRQACLYVYEVQTRLLGKGEDLLVFTQNC